MYWLIDKLRILLELSGSSAVGYKDVNAKQSNLGSWSMHVDGAIGLSIPPELVLEKYSTLSYKGQTAFEYLPEVEKVAQDLYPGQPWSNDQSTWPKGPLLPKSTGNLTLVKDDLGVSAAWNFRLTQDTSGPCGWIFEVNFDADEFYSGLNGVPRGVAMSTKGWKTLQKLAEIGISITVLQTEDEKAFHKKNQSFSEEAKKLDTGELSLESVICLASMTGINTSTGTQEVSRHWQPLLVAMPLGLSGFIASVPLSTDPQKPQVKVIKGGPL
jgi:hypothetical protein